MNDLYEGLGLIWQIQTYVERYITKSFSYKWKQRHTEEQFFEELENRFDKVFFNMNWLKFFEKNGLIELDSQIKARITSLFDRFLEDLDGIKGTNEYLNWLLYLDNILSWLLFRAEEGYKNPNFSKIMQYYRFLRAQIAKKGFLIPEPFNIEPLARYFENTQKKAKRPSCIECGSNEVVSSGINWLCKKCGRQFRKKRRA